MVEKIGYGDLLFVYGFNKCRKPSILFDNIRKGKIKLAKDLGFQSRSKHKLSDAKKQKKWQNYNTL